MPSGLSVNAAPSAPPAAPSGIDQDADSPVPVFEAASVVTAAAPSATVNGPGVVTPSAPAVTVNDTSSEPRSSPRPPESAYAVARSVYDPGGSASPFTRPAPSP